MKNHLLVIAVLAATVVGGPMYARAADPPGGSGPEAVVAKSGPGGPGMWERGRERRFARMAEFLELTDKQQEQIKALRKAEREQVAPLREQLRESRAKLRTLAETSPFDEIAVQALANSQAKVRTELIVAHARTRSQIHVLLTPEQRKLAEKLRFCMKDRRGHGRHHHKGGRMSW
jgi:Spy/CpxP family protein refolding chaperone